MPVISVIVPVYKAERFIHRCVNSILTQTFVDFELLLIDDGSPDNCGKICDEFAALDKRVKVVHKKNGGVSSARNVGIDCSSGTWLTFIDSDDWIEEDFLENFKLSDACEENTIFLQGIAMDSRKKIHVSDMFSYNESCFKSDNIEQISKYDLLKDGCPVAKLFNRNIVVDNKLYFNQCISLNEDHIFVLQYHALVDYVCLRGGNKYHYLFDYTVPSLTKIKHGVDESLQSSSLINETFLNYLKKRQCVSSQVVSNKSLRIFGFQQIVRAFKGSVFRKNEFQKCCESFEKKCFVECPYIDMYERMLFLALKRKMYNVGFLWNTFVCIGMGTHMKFRYFMKKILRK